MKKFIILVSLIALSCQDDSDGVGVPNGSPSETQWTIPSQWVFDGGPGIDGIPSIDAPMFVSFDEIGDRVLDFEFACGLKINGEVRVYPYKILDYHEIVNDEIQSEFVSVTYCPLTGTALGWDRDVDGEVVEFGVSGLLYNNNLMPYNRATGSNYSQMLNRRVQGSSVRDSVEVVQLVEMNFGAWKQFYPEAKVLSFNTGFDRQYSRYPYGSYRSVEDLLFPQESVDNRIFAKERVLGVTIDGKSRAYQFDKIGDQGVIYDEFNGASLVIFGGNSIGSFMKAFNRVLDGVVLEFEQDLSVSGAAFRDQTGTYWNVFGEAVSGPNTGKKLDYPVSYMGYWFAWAGFNPGIEIFD